MLALNRHPGLVSVVARARALLCATFAVALAACGGGSGGGGGGDMPTIHLSSTTLAFSSTVGIAPAAKQVTITNSGVGTLATPTATVTYGSVGGWLSTSVAGASAPYTVTVTPSVAGLVQGTYTATISNASTGASNTPQTVAVTFTLAAAAYGSYGGGPGQPPVARQVDPANPNNANLDTDCDGISDADEINVTHTDPANPDTDGDGIPDGVELGRTQIIEPARCTGFFVADADPTTTTNPLNPDTDGDGVPDGIEDWNHNGRLDPGESDPNVANPITTAACSTANLAPVVFDRSQPADVQLATRGFTDKQIVTVGTDEKGWLYWNPTGSIAAFALKKATVEADVTAMETAGRAALAAMGGTGTISNPLTQTFTTWDAYPAVKATYNWAATGDAKALATSIAGAFAGAGATGWSGTAGVAGPWVLQVEYVRRSGNTADIVGAFIPASLYTGAAVLAVDDVANGSAFAQSDDTGSVQCESFKTAAYSKLDILWVVDNSGSMANHQAAVKNAGTAIAQVLGNSALDWRMGLVTTAYYTTTGARDLKDFTTNLTTVTSWFDQALAWQASHAYAVGDRVSHTDAPGTQPSLNNYVCITAGTSAGSNGTWGTGANITDGSAHWAYDPTWVGTSGTGTEEGFLSAQNALNNHFLPATAAGAAVVPGKLRGDAKLVVIVLTDTEEQSSTTAASYITYFSGLGAIVNGIVCQVAGANGCSQGETQSKKYMDVVNAMGGVLASVLDFDANANTVATLDAIILTAAGAASPYTLAKSPISASFKVAMAGPTVGTCGTPPAMLLDVPRSRADGFDYYAPTNSILFYGACRPTQANTDVAVSYRYWVPGTCPADGCPPATCVPACTTAQYCDATNTCVCYADCGGCGAGYYCDTTACACVPIPG
jgi:hypothetical protein